MRTVECSRSIFWINKGRMQRRADGFEVCQDRHCSGKKTKRSAAKNESKNCVDRSENKRFASKNLKVRAENQRWRSYMLTDPGLVEQSRCRPERSYGHNAPNARQNTHRSVRQMANIHCAKVASGFCAVCALCGRSVLSHGVRRGTPTSWREL